MASFKLAHEKTMKFEGGYANNKVDKGGETYKGVARNSWPTWAGWKIIDSLKEGVPSLKILNNVLSNNKSLQDLVHKFYIDNFWKPICGDLINSQIIANNIYDFAVNSGVTRAIKYAQRITKVTEDGKCGPKTIIAINANEAGFITYYKAARLDFLRKIIARDSSQSIFMSGWRNRVENA